MKKLLTLLLTIAIVLGGAFTISAQEPHDTDTITVTVPVRVQADYTGSATAGDTQFTFRPTTMNGNDLGNGISMTTDYITLPNGHRDATGYITFTLTSSDAAMDLLENGILFRQNVGNRSGWTYDTQTYTLKFKFVEDSVSTNKYEISQVSVNNGAYQNVGGTGWQLNFMNYYKSGETVVVPPDGYEPPKKPGWVGCAGRYDFNCDGKVTCGERYGDGWIWSDSADGCVYRGTGSPNIAVDEPTNDVEVTVGDTTISASQSAWGNNNNIIVIPNTSAK